MPSAERILQLTAFACAPTGGTQGQGRQRRLTGRLLRLKYPPEPQPCPVEALKRITRSPPTTPQGARSWQRLADIGLARFRHGIQKHTTQTFPIEPRTPGSSRNAHTRPGQIAKVIGLPEPHSLLASAPPRRPQAAATLEVQAASNRPPHTPMGRQLGNQSVGRCIALR